MRNPVRLVAVLTVGACTGQSSTNLHRLAPPTLRVTGTSRAVSAAGAPDLEVSASLRNATTVRIQVTVGAQCPLFVHFLPDPSGEPVGSLDGSMACAPGG